MVADMHTLDMLTGLVYPLKLGFLVVNRSQRDIDADKNMSDALGSEAEVFRSHPQYRSIVLKNTTMHQDIRTATRNSTGPSFALSSPCNPDGRAQISLGRVGFLSCR
jgi:hypothetical protein